jgi:long-chain acyl-CoA synthetase
MNIATHMERAGRTFGDLPAIAHGASVLLNYRAVANRVARLAGALQQEFKLLKGERVALILGNCPEYIELLYACWHAGLVVVPINAKLHLSDFSFALKNSGARACFVSPKLSEAIETLKDDTLEIVLKVDEEDYRRLLRHDPLPMSQCAAEDPAWIFYTSGTTGRPKGAVLSHRNLLAMCQCYFTDVDREAPWTSILHAAPMSHGSGLYGLAHVMQGSCHVVPKSGGFDPSEVYSLIESWPGLVFFAAPTMVKRLLECPSDTDTSNLKTIIYGGGPMYVDDLLAALKRFGPKFAQLYGQGESPMTITALSSQLHGDKDHPRWLNRLASVGIPQSAVQVKTVNENGEWLPDGETGEIVVRGETVMSGYWGDIEATSGALRDGWLYTGDYGAFDEDGYLTLKGRSKDVIISGGTNIYPREVEEVILRHPSVSEVSVIGRPDREWGESVVAYLVLRAGKNVDTAALEQFCIENMARFKRPSYYRIVESLPKNNYGKVLKTDLRGMEERRDG